MKRLSTLRVRFALWIAALLILAFTTFGTFVYLRLAAGLRTALDDSLKTTAAQMIAGLNVENSRLTFSDTMPGGSSSEILGSVALMRILSPEGRVLQAVGPYAAPVMHPAELARVQQRQAVFTTVAIGSQQTMLRIYAEPVVDNSRVVGIVQVGQSVAQIDDTLRRLLAALLIAGPLLVCLSGGGGYMLATRALAPIDQIIRTAQHMSANALHERLNLPHSDDEVGRLAATLDAMLARLDEAFQRERRFTSDASHELRTPLAAMQAILGVTRSERRTSHEYERALDDLAAETDRLHGLVEEMLRLARSEELDPSAYEPIDLSTLLDDIGEALRPRADAQGLWLRVQVPGGLVVLGHRDWLIGLFMNILDNALKYTTHGGITISANSHGSEVCVAIADTGIGIPAEHLPQIFNRFYRVDPSRSTPGTGLGLAIARDIVQAHGGVIDLASVPGSGTTFTIRLPCGPHERSHGQIVSPSRPLL